eukprot:363865-Chlamydomonas_euryale.AAC.31
MGTHACRWLQPSRLTVRSVRRSARGWALPLGKRRSTPTWRRPSSRRRCWNALCASLSCSRRCACTWGVGGQWRRCGGAGRGGGGQLRQHAFSGASLPCCSAVQVHACVVLEAKDREGDGARGD